MHSALAFLTTLVEIKPPLIKPCGLSPARTQKGRIRSMRCGGFCDRSWRQKSFDELPKPSTDTAKRPAAKSGREALALGHGMSPLVNRIDLCAHVAPPRKPGFGTPALLTEQRLR
jgi:hypothetical protein